ncbi:unnamed protein product [Adineta steineri]|uniref:Uncharacterized protein n=1 Tax=Adineta steineri TaxID=433720 RepID=A0A814R3E4_9BILA|nr:unnamed protein product [Adineta steineri]CAF1468914.1 unnamed protein product [Adineta steineri]CAF1469430.1 unnamed protein product [Adineta steineri]
MDCLLTTNNTTTLFDSPSIWTGYISVAVAVFFFGSSLVPAAKYPVGDGWASGHFGWFDLSGILLTVSQSIDSSRLLTVNMKKRIIGCSLAIVAGTLFGLVFTPSTYIQDHQDKYPGAMKNGLNYIFAMYTGILLTSSVYYGIYLIFKRNRPYICIEKSTTTSTLIMSSSASSLSSTTSTTTTTTSVITISAPIIIAMREWTMTGNMNVARMYHTASTLANGYVLVTGGESSDASLNSAELYNPSTGTWTNTGNMNVGRRHHKASTLTNGHVLVTGGCTSSDINCVAIKSVELYNPSTGTWANTGNMNVGRQHHTASTLPNGYVLIAGGKIGASPINSAELYNPLRGIWTSTRNMNFARYDHTASILANGHVLVAGGVASGNSDTAELYNPSTGTWTTTGDMRFFQSCHTATILANGSVLVAGFSGKIGRINPELYNPSTGTWTTTGIMNHGRCAHTASLLANGYVLVTNGKSGGDYSHSPELYNPSTNTWTMTGNMNVARMYHTASTLANGYVLVTGGESSEDAINTAELYQSISP